MYKDNIPTLEVYLLDFIKKHNTTSDESNCHPYIRENLPDFLTKDELHFHLNYRQNRMILSIKILWSLPLMQRYIKNINSQNFKWGYCLYFTLYLTNCGRGRRQAWRGCARGDEADESPQANGPSTEAPSQNHW